MIKWFTKFEEATEKGRSECLVLHYAPLQTAIFGIIAKARFFFPFPGRHCGRQCGGCLGQVEGTVTKVVSAS